MILISINSFPVSDDTVTVTIAIPSMVEYKDGDDALFDKPRYIEFERGTFGWIIKDYPPDLTVQQLIELINLRTYQTS